MINLIIVIGLFTTPAYAQEAELHTAAEEQDILWEERVERAEGFRAAALHTRQGMRLFADLSKDHEILLAEHRGECRLALRRANRDTRLSTTMRCYRAQLVLQREFIQRQMEYFETIPGITETVRAPNITKQRELLTAIDAVIFGLESGVYGSVEEAEEAKANLRDLYRVPAALGRLYMRADRMQTWIAHLMFRMLSLVQTTPISDHTFAQVSTASLCFEQGEALLRQVIDTEEYQESNFMFSQTLLHLQTCSPILREAHKIHTSEKEVLTDEEF
ncbi:MAG: hypothetical protein O2904_00975 [bacterium]|nr:hypothetical protein [bacterium]